MVDFIHRSTKAVNVSWDATTPDLWMTGSTLNVQGVSGSVVYSFGVAGTTLTYQGQSGAGGATTTVTAGGRNFNLRSDMLGRLEDGHSTRILGSEGGFTGDSLTVVELEGTNSPRLLVGIPGREGFYTLSQNGSDWTQAYYRSDYGNTYAAYPTAMATYSLGGKDWVVTAGALEHGVTLWEVDWLGRIYGKDRLGQNEGLGINAPTVLRNVEIDGAQMVIVGSAGSGSLTVLQMSANGTMTVLDHVLDDLTTRFDNVQVVETAVINGITYVVAGGGDDGLTAFILLPDGRLVPIATIADTQGTSLVNVNGLQLHVAGSRLHIFATSEREAGVTHLTLDFDGTGRLRDGGAGSAAVNGTAGDDVLLDGGGADTLTGGGGADLFILSEDGDLDTITDFQVGTDRIDLSAWTGLYSVSQLTITELTNGVQIVYRGETLRIMTSNGQTITASDLNQIDMLGLFQNLRQRPDEPDENTYEYDIKGSDVDDTLRAGADGDNINGYGGNDLIIGGAGSDVLAGGLDNDTLRGAGGRDTLLGSYGRDRLEGGDANDLLSGGDGLDLLYGQAGFDTLSGGSGSDTLIGGTENDVLYGGAGNDLLFGQQGDDRIIAEEGNDIIRDYSGRNLIYGGEGDDLVFASVAQDTIFGNGGRDTIVSGGGNDVVRGDLGNDWLFGAAGNDRLYGGHGNDTLRGGQGVDVLFGGDGNDRMFSVGGRDRLFGEGGSDFIVGSDLVDVMYGQSGNDILIGYGGNDRLDVGEGRNFAFGHGGNDFLIAGRSRDVLNGGAGQDTILAGGGHDYVIGGQGNDQMYGQIGNDVLRADAGNDVLSGGSGDDLLNALGGNDHLIGGPGADRLYGGPGRDQLSGGGGNDLLNGGGGADRFIFNAGRFGNDVITGFAQADELFVVRGLVGGMTNARQVLNRYAENVQGGVELDLGVHGTITVEGQSIASLADNLVIA